MFKLVEISVFGGLVLVWVFFIPISKVAIHTLLLLTLVKMFLSFCLLFVLLSQEFCLSQASSVSGFVSFWEENVLPKGKVCLR